MKVTVSMTIDVDPDTWRRYAMDEPTATLAEVRADVRTYVFGQVLHSNQAEEDNLRITKVS